MDIIIDLAMTTVQILMMILIFCSKSLRLYGFSSDYERNMLYAVISFQIVSVSIEMVIHELKNRLSFDFT